MDTVTETQSAAPPLFDKAFFGKDNCLSVQVRGSTCFFKWGRKNTTGWDWKSVKFSDVELGDILRVLLGDVDEAKFYHSFKNEATQIWIRRVENALVLKAGDFTKGLNSGEQQVLRVMLEHGIWMMNIT